MPDAPVTVRTLSPGDVPSTSRALARAFDDDPLMRYLYPFPRRRALALRQYFAAVLRDALAFDEVYGAFAGSTVLGAAAWLPPDAYPPGPRRETTMLLASASSVLTWSRLVAQLTVLTTIATRHPKYRHWYLGLIGTHPTWQGSGVGHALLDPVHTRLDAAGEVAYLETQTRSNVGWYRGQGYEVVDEFSPAPGSPPLWTMTRSPRPPTI